MPGMPSVVPPSGLRAGAPAPPGHYHTGLLVPVEGVGGNRGGAPAALDQPDDQRDNAAEDDQGQQEDQEHPAVSSHGCDIAGHAGLGVAAEVSANRGQITRHLTAILDSSIAADGGNVPRD